MRVAPAPLPDDPEVPMVRRSVRAQVKRMPVVGPAARRAAGRRGITAPMVDDDAAGPTSTYGDAYDYVFVVTHGRSGSTLLTGILNSIPGYLVRGENQGYVHHLFKAHRAVMARRQSQLASGEPTTSTHPWFGVEDYPPGVALDHMRRLVVDTLLRPAPDSRVLGFKEIRYGQQDVVEHLTFLRTLFPSTKFVFNTRNREEVLRSDWWADRDPADLDVILTRMAAAEEAHADVSCHVHYDDYRDDAAALQPLFDFLGEEFDVDTVREVMAVRHSY